DRLTEPSPAVTFRRATSVSTTRRAPRGGRDPARGPVPAGRGAIGGPGRTGGSGPGRLLGGARRRRRLARHRLGPERNPAGLLRRLRLVPEPPTGVRAGTALRAAPA